MDWEDLPRCFWVGLFIYLFVYFYLFFSGEEYFCVYVFACLKNYYYISEVGLHFNLSLCIQLNWEWDTFPLVDATSHGIDFSFQPVLHN